MRLSHFIFYLLCACLGALLYSLHLPCSLSPGSGFDLSSLHILFALFACLSCPFIHTFVTFCFAAMAYDEANFDKQIDFNEEIATRSPLTREEVRLRQCTQTRASYLFHFVTHCYPFHDFRLKSRPYIQQNLRHTTHTHSPILPIYLPPLSPCLIPSF